MYERTATAETETDDTDHEHHEDTAHLDDVEDGCGCTEIWEHLSERRED